MGNAVSLSKIIVSFFFIFFFSLIEMDHPKAVVVSSSHQIDDSRTSSTSNAGVAPLNLTSDEQLSRDESIRRAGGVSPPITEESVRIGSPPLSPQPNEAEAGVSVVIIEENVQPPPAADPLPLTEPLLSASRLTDDDQRECSVSFYSTKKEKAISRFLEYGVSSEQGSRKTMEDQHKAMLSTDLVTPRDRQGPRMELGIPFFGVYDGHGGTQCAEFLRENLHSFVLSHPSIRTDPERAIKEAVAEAEKIFMEKCRTERIESGSTVAIALMLDDLLVTGNVGDSEIVMCRAGGAAKLLTVKHTLGSNDGEVERVKACGGRIFHNRVGHPKFNPTLVSLAVSRAIGDAGFKLEEYTDGKPSGLIAEAETLTTEIEPGDRFFVIGCDGLWDVMTYQTVVDFCIELLKNGCNTQQVTEHLCKEALRLGSTDNVTALFVNLASRPKSAGGRPTSSGSRCTQLQH